MSTPQHADTPRARVSLTTARWARVRTSHDAVPHLHEGWLRIASVLQPLRWWSHMSGCRSRGLTPVPYAGLIFCH